MIKLAIMMAHQNVKCVQVYTKSYGSIKNKESNQNFFHKTHTNFHNPMCSNFV